MNTVNDIATGLRVPSQIPLNPKQEAASENALKSLGTGNTLAYTYYEGMTVFCKAEESTWIWRKPHQGESGLLNSHFTYPSGRIVNGVNYGGQSFNFFKVKANQDIQSLLDNLKFSLDWKRGSDYYNKPATELPSLVTNSVHTRKGYVGCVDPIVASNLVVHPPTVYPVGPCTLLEAHIFNLGVSIKDFSNIAPYAPKLVISKYSYSKNKGNTTRVGEANEDYSRKGSYKISKIPSLTRPNYIPLKGKYQVIDFGQEHYFRTETLYAAQTDENFPLPIALFSRGNGRRYTQTKFNSVVDGKDYYDVRAFVYLEFQIEVTIDTRKYLSKPLQRLKMFIHTSIKESVEDSGIFDAYKERVIIRYKHV